MTETTKLLVLCVVLAIINLCCSYSDEPRLKINKCCEVYELLVDSHCTHVNHTSSTIWEPRIRGPYTFGTGFPNCGSHQIWPIYSNNSTDLLDILPNGGLRHSLYHSKPSEDYDEMSYIQNDLNEMMHYDYEPGKYCMEKRIEGKTISEYALVCIDHTPNWTNPEFIMRNIINPISHGISIISLLFIAIVYFVMPTLRDLVGNIVTTISICLIVSQAADMVRLLTVFTSHISLIITETFCYVSLLGAFFWLNSLSYYIWKTFKSRNVFLRITDGKKYCYYSAYCWSCTVILGSVAIFAHYVMDYPQIRSNSPEAEQESIGSLGIIIFFMPVAITILVNVFFFATTFKIINRMNIYGRIHRKLRHSFRMFLMLFMVMTICWVFFLMSFTKFDGLIYCHIVVNAFQGPIILYICTINQKHVSYQIKQHCCYTNCLCYKLQPEPECDWGDELAAMNSGSV